jgi:hypothetical protein
MSNEFQWPDSQSPDGWIDFLQLFRIPALLCPLQSGSSKFVDGKTASGKLPSNLHRLTAPYIKVIKDYVIRPLRSLLSPNSQDPSRIG